MTSYSIPRIKNEKRGEKDTTTTKQSMPIVVCHHTQHFPTEE